MNGVVKNQLYRQIVDSLVNRDVKQTFDIPSSVVRVSVEKETYPVQKPSANTPGDMIVSEYCKKGTEPSTVSTRYNKLDTPKNLSLTETDKKVTLNWGSVAQPKTTSLDYFKSYYKVLYAQHIEEKFAEMQAANGAFGYAIMENGNQIDFTTNTSYSLNKREYDAVYTVRAMYQNNGITQSADSNAVSVTGKKKPIEPDDYEVTNTSSSRSAKVNSELLNLTGGVTVKDPDGKDITKDCDIIASNCSPESGCELDSSNDSAKFTEKGEYTISISVSYKGTELPSPKSITVTVTE